MDITFYCFIYLVDTLLLSSGELLPLLKILCVTMPLSFRSVTGVRIVATAFSLAKKRLSERAPRSAEGREEEALLAFK